MRSKNEETILNIIEYINEKFFTVREIPSVQEIADHIGVVKSTVSKYLTEMENRGLITRDNTHYSIETLKMKKTMKNTQQLPIVGNIACGTPIIGSC